MTHDDLVLLPETIARRALGRRLAAFSVLAPLGAYAGRGTLRVLRVRSEGEAVDLVCGYDSYEPLSGTV